MQFKKRNEKLLKKLAEGNPYLSTFKRGTLENLPITRLILKEANHTTDRSKMLMKKVEAVQNNANKSIEESSLNFKKAVESQKVRNKKSKKVSVQKESNQQVEEAAKYPRVENLDFTKREKSSTKNNSNNEQYQSSIKKSENKTNKIVENQTSSSSSLTPLEDAINNHDAGIKGNKLAVKKAYASLKELHQKNPNDLMIKAYYGSATTLLARDASSVTDKMKYALEGLKYLDGVVDKSPDFILGRFLRGNVAYRLPELYFQRTATAIEDFRYLVDAFEENRSILSERDYIEVLKNLVEASKRVNQLDNAKNYQDKLKALKQNEKPSPNDGTQLNTNGEVESTGEGLTDEAITYYQNALNGGPDEVKEALSFFEVFVLTNEAKEVEMTYLDLQSMLGRDSINTYEMFGSAIKSMKAMDALISEHPSLHELRIIRARHSLRLPEIFFRRAAIAVSDIEMLLKDAEFSKKAEKETLNQLLFDLGRAYEKLDMLDDAFKIWYKLLKQSPNKRLISKIQEKIEIHSYKEMDLKIFSSYPKEKLYNKGKEIHSIGAKGSRLAAKQSLEVWEKAKNTFPDCEVANTYYAASVALMGKYASDPQEMFGETIKGLKLLKSSIKSDNPELKYLRGCIYQCLPEGFFHTSDKAVKDFKSVKAAYDNNQDNPPITKDQYIKLLYDLGHLFKKTSFVDKALKTWKTLVKEYPQSEYAQMIARQVGEVE